MDKKNVFFIMPFTEEFFEVFETIKMKFSDEFEFSHAGEEGNQQNILKDIIQPIFEADVIVADLTNLNPNVMYELGIAHALNKKTITITQDELSSLPFDLKQYRAKDYNTHYKKFDQLVEYLKTNLRGAIDNSVIYGNPVKDFLKMTDNIDIPLFSEKTDIDLESDTENGFLDFMAGIEADSEKLAMNINDMTSEMDEMNRGIQATAENITKAQKNGGSSTASFVRKETKKAARFIEDFSRKLSIHNRDMALLWDEIEKNSIGLIENPFAGREENRENLANYLSSLYKMKKSAKFSADAIESLKGNLDTIVGLERSMNQAIRFAKDDLTTYVVFTERIGKSIEKILQRAKVVVGEICLK